MSHAATNWAIRQRGLKPASKIVLWHLADCHNAHTGQCNPMQKTLAEMCEMSRSTLNLHLDALEAAGLIRRITSVDEQTKKQRPTSYVLAFDDVENPMSENRTRPQDVVAITTRYSGSVSENKTRAVSENAEKPCPKNGQSRVRNSDTIENPGKEPGSLAAREASPSMSEGVRLRGLVVSAMGLTGAELNTSAGFIVGGCTPGEVEMSFSAWRQTGLTEAQILAAISAKLEAQRQIQPGFLPRGLRFFDGPIQDFAARLNGKGRPANPSQQSDRDRSRALWRRVAAS